MSAKQLRIDCALRTIFAASVRAACASCGMGHEACGTMTMTRAAILEDPRVRGRACGKGLRALGVKVDVLAHHPSDLLIQLARMAPPVVVIDASHPTRDRLRVVRAVARRHPGVRIVVVGRKGDGNLALHCRALGAFCCIDRPEKGPHALARAIASAARSKANKGAITEAALERLTPRELQVLDQIAFGGDNLKIAALLGVTERTVKAHLTSIYAKLGAQNRVELALAARGLLAA
jgi:DNA-binding NarL/FixJ family response regulator